MTTRNKRKKYKKSGGTRKKTSKCSPAVKGNTINKNSCIKKSLLSNTIFEGNQSIRDVIDECTNDDKCIISKITDDNKRREIENISFVPKQPSEWKLNINEWLSDADILQVISQYEDAYKEFIFMGPSYIDFDHKLYANECVENSLCNFSLQECIKNGHTKIGIIFNLDDHTKSGSHWVSLYIDVKGKYMFYFDSAANPIPKEITILVERIKQQAKLLNMRFKLHTNGGFEHQYNNTECGMYSLFFIITMLTNQYENKVFKNTKQKISFFKKHRISDKYVEELRHEYFTS
jgi:hypothetical protein